MNPALEYAEDVLGVHQVYDDSQALLKELDEAMTALDAAIDARRTLDDKIEDHQMEVLIALRGTLGGEISQAAFDKRLKETYNRDQTLRRLKQDRNAKAGEASGLELDIEHIKYRLKVAVGRMEELGGYFNFLAVTKYAELQARYAEASTPPVQAAGGESTEN